MIDVQRHQAELNPDGNRPATVAEVFMDNVHTFRLRLGGILLQALAPRFPCAR